MEINAKPVNDVQIGGDHYKTSDYQLWDLASDIYMHPLLFGACKYAVRYPKKGGAEDLNKAIHFLEKYRTRVKQQDPFCENYERARDCVFRFVRENGFDSEQVKLIWEICFLDQVYKVDSTIEKLQDVAARYVQEKSERAVDAAPHGRTA